MPSPASSGADGTTPSLRWAFAVIALLFLGAVALVVVAINRPEPPSYVPTPPGQLGTPDPSGAYTTTIDASTPERWVFFSFTDGVLAGRPAPADWDLAFRRFHIITNGGPGFTGAGGVQDLGAIPFDAVTSAPGSEFTATTLAGRDSTNAAIARWYRYGFTSHLLTPLGNTYVVRGAEGGAFKLQLLGYYCPAAVPGCVTFRWAQLP